MNKHEAIEEVRKHLNLEGPKARVLILSKTRKHARCFVDTLKQNGTEFKPDDRNNSVASTANGGYVMFNGDDNPQSFEGPQWSCILLVRPSELNSQSMKNAQLGLRLGPCIEIVID